jgi:guanylate kinase
VGLDGFKEYSPDSVISFFLEASEEVRKERCKIRGDYEEKEWGYRLESDNNMFTDDFIENNIDYVIDAERTPEEILKSINTSFIKNRIKSSLKKLMVSAEILKTSPKPSTKEQQDSLDELNKSFNHLNDYLNDIIK